MFIHQDFEFNSSHWLEDVENILKNLEILGLLVLPVNMIGIVCLILNDGFHQY